MKSRDVSTHVNLNLTERLAGEDGNPFLGDFSDLVPTLFVYVVKLKDLLYIS